MFRPPIGSMGKTTSNSLNLFANMSRAKEEDQPWDVEESMIMSWLGISWIHD